MTLERLQDCLTQAQELLDELPVVYLTASQETTYQIDILNETLDELFESAANKGYTDPRKRREHRQSPGRDNSRPQIVSSASQATNPPVRGCETLIHSVSDPPTAARTGTQPGRYNIL
jgi:hypothetical protein